MPVTLESNRILIDTVEVETVKTHVPEVDIDIDIVPAITNSEGDPAFEILTYTHSGGSENQTEFNLTINEDTTCDILIVGGGGGGGRWRAGGGGGDVLYFENITLNGTYNINVGKGGSVPRGTPTSAHHFGGFSGETSSITGGYSSYILNVNAGGGGGAGGWSLDALPGVTVSYTNPLTGNTETSSGGGAGTSKITQTPSSGNSVSGNGGQGDYDGWENSSDDGAGGGGGGGGTNGHGGIPSGETGGLGGDGETIDITGNSIMYGKGGNGWGNNDPQPTTTPPNIGQGGAGAEYNYGTHIAGGSGIVIIRKYLKPSALYEEQTTVTQNPLLPADSTNLVAWYKFDGDFTDSSGNGNDLITNTGTPTTSTAQFKFGESAYLISSSLKTNSFTFHNKAFSISIWIYTTGSSNRLYNLISQNKAGSQNQNLHIRVNKQSNTSIYYTMAFWANDLNSSSGYDDYNKWAHIVFQINSNGYKEIWRNGVMIANDTNGSFLNTDNADIVIGNWTQDNKYFEGYLDNLRIYDKALSAYEIDILANNKIENPDYNILTFEYQGPSYPVIDADAASLVAHYKFDSGEELTDSVGNYPLTNDGSVSFPSDTKIVGKSSYFPNSDYDGFLNITGGFNPYTIWNGNGISFSIWYNMSSSSDAYGRIFEFGDDSSNRVLITRNNTNNAFNIRMVSSSGGDSQLVDLMPGTIDDNWHHIIWSIDTNGNWELYLDGENQLISMTANVPNISYNISRLGKAIYKSDATQDLKGYLDDFRIYDKALSATEISDLYNQYNQTVYTVNFQAESECDILIVGGGGAGGNSIGGGGGAGGVVYTINQTLNGTYKIGVGRGGIGLPLLTTGQGTVGIDQDGKDSFIKNSDGSYVNMNMGGTSYNLVGFGGGGGGVYHTGTLPGRDGGSGGGSAERENSVNNGGSSIQPNTLWNGTSYVQGGSDGNGNLTTDGNYYAPGGGGAGGTNFNNIYNGKNGIQIDITGINNYYAGGGGGGQNQQNDNSRGIGANNIGGNGRIYTGSSYVREATNGVDGTGSGGGGGAYTGNPDNKAGSGGSGIVIIRYYTKYIRQHPAYDAQWTYHSANPNVHHYGNVGIGTLASETNKLTVKGDMNMIGNYKQNDVNLGNWYSSDNIHNIHRLTGNVGIGTTDPQYSIDTSGVLYASHGGFTGGTSTNWATSSDERIKDNITSASNETCYENVKNINLYKFNYKEQFANNKNETQYGFIAQEVQKYYPKAVKYEKIKVKDDTYENFLTINQTQLNYTLFGAVKHLQLELENIKVKLGMTVPVTEETVTEEPVVEETNTTEEPVVEETNTTEEPVVEETNTTDEPAVEETNTTEEPVVEEPNTT